MCEVRLQDLQFCVAQILDCFLQLVRGNPCTDCMQQLTLSLLKELVLFTMVRRVSSHSLLKPNVTLEARAYSQVASEHLFASWPWISESRELQAGLMQATANHC